MKNKLFISIILLLSIFILQSCHYAKAKKEFINNFDLELTGKVIDVKNNKYGQTLVCLEVIKSNYQDFFPIHDPDKYSDSKISENRFFIKVEGGKAIFIFEDENRYNYITSHIVKSAIITINEDNNKMFTVYNQSQTEDYGKLSIFTYPIRDNIKNSCLYRN